MQMPTEAEITNLVSGDLRYRRSLLSLLGSMCLSLMILVVAAYFSLTVEGQSEPALVVVLLIYYPAYYWATALGYSEILTSILKNKFSIDDPLLGPKLFALTRSRAQRVHGILAVVLSLAFIGKANAAENLAGVITPLAIIGWLTWIPVNIAYFRATAKGAVWLYPQLLDSRAATATIIIPGVIFHFVVGAAIPLLILLAPFVLPRILRRDQIIPARDG